VLHIEPYVDTVLTYGANEASLHKPRNIYIYIYIYITIYLFFNIILKVNSSAHSCFPTCLLL
jgi:hypothetical protein